MYINIQTSKTLIQMNINENFLKDDELNTECHPAVINRTPSGDRRESG